MKHLSQTEMDLLPCGIVKIDKNRKLLQGNRYAQNLLSSGPEDIILGRNINEFTSNATRIFLDSYVYPMILNEGRAEELQLNLKSATGVTSPIVANIQLNKDQTTYWTFMSCVNRDQLYVELLEARDAHLTQAQNLDQINTQLQKRQSDLQAFCHSLSHDFIGPLLRIRQQTEFALEGLLENGIEAPEDFELLRGARSNTETLIELTRGLVDYLVADVAVSRNEAVDLEEIVSTVLSMREEQNSPPPKVHRMSLPTIFGNKAQIQIMFKNLIENAVKYNENDPEITISHTENANDQILIAIKDNGIGISDRNLNTIFKPFTRLNSGSQYKGNGLGLSIVSKMVEHHNGEIRVESSLGSGSTFYVSLPLNAANDDDL